MGESPALPREGVAGGDAVTAWGPGAPPGARPRATLPVSSVLLLGSCLSHGYTSVVLADCARVSRVAQHLRTD